MPRHVDDRDAGATVELKHCEAEIDCNAAGLFFRQAVGVGPRELLNQARLAVIDVARGAENEGRLWLPVALLLSAFSGGQWSPDP